MYGWVVAALFVTSFLPLIPTAGRADSASTLPVDPTQPSPRMLELIQREHHPKDWLFVTSPQGRLELRARRIDAVGLAQLEVRRRQSAPTEPIPWSSVERIEVRESRFRLGQVVGLTAGLLIGGFAGGAIGESASSATESHNDAGAFTGMAIGAAMGAWLGGRLGDRVVDSRLVYEAQPTPQNAASIDKARTVVKSEDVLRVRGSFGEFAGRAGSIDGDGLAGLERNPQLDPSTAAPPQLLPWSQVVRVDRLGTSSRRYAAILGVGLGLGIGALASAASAGLEGSDNDNVAAFAVGTLAGGALGTGLGAWIGSGVPRWHNVYERAN